MLGVIAASIGVDCDANCSQVLFFLFEGLIMEEFPVKLHVAEENNVTDRFHVMKFPDADADSVIFKVLFLFFFFSLFSTWLIAS